MKPIKLLPALFAVLAITAFAFQKRETQKGATAKLEGTWRLASSKIITKGVTETTYPVKDQEMIKMFNGTHFAFFRHDVKRGKGTDPVFEAGSGTYSLKGNKYTEHLKYCSARDWENTNFDFTLDLKQDTLIQKGIERIDSLNVNREIVEVYLRLR